MTTYAAPSPPMIPARYHGGSQTPKAIVIHATVSSDNAGTARHIAEWWSGSSSPKTSAHYTVDPKEVIQSVGDHTVAYHCGSNQDCIGIELCDEQTGPASRWADADSTAILARAAKLTAQLCLAYGIEIRRPSVTELKQKGKHGIYGHNDSRLAFGNTTHTDPKDFPWAAFIAAVKVEAEKLKGTTTPASAPVGPPTFHDLTIALERLADKSTSKTRRSLLLSARGVLGALVANSDHNRIPTTVSGVISALAAKRTVTKSVTTKARLTAAITLLKPLT